MKIFYKAIMTIGLIGFGYGSISLAANPYCRIQVKISNKGSLAASNIISNQLTERTFVPEFQAALQSPYVSMSNYCRDISLGLRQQE